MTLYIQDKENRQQYYDAYNLIINENTDDPLYILVRKEAAKRKIIMRKKGLRQRKKITI